MISRWRSIALVCVVACLAASAVSPAAEPTVDPFNRLRWSSPSAATVAPHTTARVDTAVTPSAAVVPAMRATAPAETLIPATSAVIRTEPRTVDAPAQPAPLPMVGAATPWNGAVTEIAPAERPAVVMPPASPLSAANLPAAARLDGYAPNIIDMVKPPADTLPPTEGRIESVRFNGVQPGVSTADDLRRAWGNPAHSMSRAGVVHHRYDLPPFKDVEVTIYKERVLEIVVWLAQEFPTQVLEQHLDIRDAPALYRGESGDFAGQIYPSRGVTFEFMTGRGERRVSKISLEGIDAENFVLRAQGRLRNDYTSAMADLDLALAVDPACARAHWMRGKILAIVGRHGEALSACEEALGIEPDNGAFRLTRAEILAENARLDEALTEARAVADAPATRPELKARAYLSLGNFVAAAAARDYSHALDLHMQAIKLAEPLLQDRRLFARRMAKETMVEAHLAAAQDIAFGNWQMKQEVVSKWLDRGKWLCDHMQKTDGLDPDLPLQTLRGSMAATVGLHGQQDPGVWTEELLRLGRKNLADANDPLRAQEIHWLLGLALYDAVQTHHMRGETSRALDYGMMAVEHVEPYLESRQLTPREQLVVGRLYYRVGLIHATEHGDHTQAVAWFDKALPLVSTPQPVSAASDPGQQGETLVSIAVSLWQVSRRDEALAVTRDGLGLMEQAVRDGYLLERALAVPYSNLATMHTEMGDAERARNYHELATKLESSGTLR